MKNNKKGFTLTEIIAVILVIALILLVAIPAIYSHVRKGREKINESNMTALELAAREYYSENRGELPNYNLYSLVLGTFLRDLNYLPDMSDSDGNNCDESYVVVENKNGEYIYHTCLICGGEKYKGNDAICNSDSIGPTDKCPSGQVCNPTCTIAPTKDAVGKWVKDVTFGVLGLANQKTSYPILSAKMYFDNKALTSSDYDSGSKGTAKYMYGGVNAYFEYKLSKNGIYKMYENSTGDIGARVADMGNKYSDICNYKNGTVLICTNDECKICIGNSCNKCTGSGCNPPSEDPTIKPDDNCDISTGTCTNPTEECNAGEICIDNKKPTCSITKAGNVLTITATDDLSGIKEIIDPSGQKMTKNTYDIVNATSKYVFTVRDRADNEGTCSYTSIGVSVKYDANGGTNAPAAQSTFAGETITITSSEPKKAGSAFAKKWCINKDGTGTCYKAGDKYKANQSVTLYAQWNACGAGTYSDAAHPTCTGCPNGKYSTGSGNTSCTSCPSNSYNNGTGNFSCSCKPGYYSATGNIPCTQCEAGYYCTGGTNHTSCGSGKTSPAGSDSASDCVSVDTTGPTITASPGPGKYYDGTDITFTCTDSSGVKEIHNYWSKEGVSRGEDTTRRTISGTTATHKFKFGANGTNHYSKYDFTITCVDNYNNTSTANYTYYSRKKGSTSTQVVTQYNCPCNCYESSQKGCKIKYSCPTGYSWQGSSGHYYSSVDGKRACA